MNRQWYKKTPERDMVGKRVQSTCEIGNQVGSLPEGTQFTIQGKQGGLCLESDPCRQCGLRLVITKVQPAHVQLLDEREARG